MHGLGPIRQLQVGLRQLAVSISNCCVTANHGELHALRSTLAIQVGHDRLPAITTGVQGAPAAGILQSALGQAKSRLDAAAGGDVRQRVAGALNQGAAMAGEAASQAGKVLSGALSQVEGQLQGTQAGAMLDRAKEMAQQNPMATGAALGGIATVLLGTQTGRAVAGDMRSISTRPIGTKG